MSYLFIYLFIQHLYSALFTNKYALMRYNKYVRLNQIGTRRDMIRYLINYYISHGLSVFI